MNGGALLAAQPAATGPAGGTYQLVIDPATVGAPRPPRYLTVVFDQRTVSGGAAYTVGAAMDHIRSALLTQLSPTDSFAFFYVHNNAVVQAGGPGWRPARTDTVLTTLAGVPAAPSGELGKLEDLLKSALQHAAGRPGTNSTAVVFSNTTAAATQAITDTIFNHVANHLGGSYPTKIYVLNSSISFQWTGTSNVLAGDLLWTKLTAATGGVRHRYTNLSYIYINPGTGGFVGGYTYDFPVRSILKNIVRSMGHYTPSYDVAIPVPGGFSYGWHDILGPGRWSEHSMYAEVGRYAGTLSPSGGIAVQYMTPTGLLTSTVPITLQPSGADTLMREAWTYNYITDLLTFNNTAYQAECIDSSIRARVLCPLTAFLALETGDTVGVSQPGSVPTTGIGEAEPTGPSAAGEAWLTASPNPFTDAVSIAFHAEPVNIEIFDATGRRVWWGRATGKRLRWDGTDATGRTLPPGLYVLRVHFADRVATLKFQKR